MKRSAINKVIGAAKLFFNQNGWTLPPSPRWDVTDFGLDSFLASGLVLVNLAEEVEYCEKLMYAVKNQLTPAHTHKKKKEDIICRIGKLVIQLWSKDPKKGESGDSFNVKINGVFCLVKSGDTIHLSAGERVTIVPGIWHAFYPSSEECIIGEVSTANDDLNDNFFSDAEVGRFSEILEDEPAIVKLVSDK
ncbi:D-lyxose/D-mannose family sugar isomerase [Pedobacter cryophilus]|uniref:D-lyxose ketol-isomerase n=1 Tax=Pedobacter cryophilus TaxID=2571271 RepID=A0A4V5NX45_9SPHI|nr:D-lyxose/D-mannose family sugar isomerase [Pedobacter cryophilus]TKB96383.1 D-lyxose/D-mannose family sugar isomerase [Pedobacter cryophilus]